MGQVEAVVYSDEERARAFNLWMDDYARDPAQFEDDQERLGRHLRERNGGQEPTYGQLAVATFDRYCRKTRAGE
jgi:hypothetical protein